MHYFLKHTPARERSLQRAKIPFTSFTNGGQKGFLIENAALPQVLTSLRATVEREENSEYEGVQVVHLSRARVIQTNGAAMTPIRPLTVSFERWGRGPESWAYEFKLIAQEIAPKFTTLDVVIYDNNYNGGGFELYPRNDGKFTIFLWAGPNGKPGHGANHPTELFGVRISDHSSVWRYVECGSGIPIKDQAGAIVGEMVENNLFIHYPITSFTDGRYQSEIDAGLKLFRKILEEVAATYGATPEELAKRRLEIQRQTTERLQTEARANPVVVKRWERSSILREVFTSVALDFFQAFGEKQIQIYDYSDETKKHVPSTDGRVHICIWSSAESPKREDDEVPQELFGVPLKASDGYSVLKPCNLAGTLLMDEDGKQVGKIVGDTIYIHYPLTKRYVDFRWGDEGVEALFRRILEEAVFQKTATEEQKAARSREIIEKCRAKTKERFKRACAGRIDLQIAAARKTIENHPGRVRDLQLEIVKLIRENDDAKKIIGNIETRRAESEAFSASEFEKILQIPKVTDVRVDGNVIKLFTDILYCVDPRSRVNHEIGKFRIEMSVGGEVRWFNLTRKVDGMNRRHNAPHVWENGKACLGNMDEVIPQLVAHYEFAALAMIAISFIESVNVDDQAGQHIDQWPVAA